MRGKAGSTFSGNGIEEASASVISVLAKADNYRIFAAAKQGVRYSPQAIEKMGLSRKRYYNALSQLNRYGLVRKDPATGMNVCTTFGEMVCRCISELRMYEDHFEELKMIDALRQTGQFTPDRIMDFLEKVAEDDKITRNLFGAFDIVWAYDDMVAGLLERIRRCSSEILIATKLPSEEVEHAIYAKAAGGVRVQVLYDVSLVESYFDRQGTARTGPEAEDNACERTKIWPSPRHPEPSIECRVASVSLGMMVVDARDAALELVNDCDGLEFSCGLFAQDRRVARAVKSHYQKLWAQSEEFACFR